MTGILVSATMVADDSIASSKPLSAVWVILAVAAAVAVAYGLKRFADHVLLTKGDTCRLEGER